MKNHPVIRIRISKAKIAKPNARLIMIESKSPKQRFMSDHIGNILVCETTTHCFFLFVYFSAIMFIFFMWVELHILGLTFLDSDTIVNFLFLFICRQRHLLSCCRLSIGECWPLDFFPFQHRLSREQYRAFEISIAPFVPSFVSSYCPRCLRKSVSPSPVLYTTDSLKGAPVCMHFVVK